MKWVNKICKMAIQKLSALVPISDYTTFDKRKIIMKAFIISHFSDCSLVWMFHRMFSKFSSGSSFLFKTIPNGRCSR